MGFAKKAPRWRSWLTPAEAQRVEEIDAKIEDAKAAALERAGIANRAIQRLRYRERQQT